MGRDAVGVRGIKLKEGDYVVGSGRAVPGSSLLSITENGYGKRTLVEEYFRGESGDPQKRGGSGMKAYQCTDKTGKIAGVRVVEEHEDILMITDDGTIIRTAVSDINVYSRVTQGVRVMRLDDGVHIISIASADKEEEEKTSEE